MKYWKRFVAKLLVAATIVTSVELSWLDLSGTGKVMASVSECIYDAYDLYNDLYKSMDDVDSGRSTLDAVMGIKLRTSDFANTNASDSYSDSTSWKSSSDNVINGLYTFNQKGIVTTAQVKSGNWLDDTNYEAMAGTPTTEPLFVNMGGNQWIVDLQYRYVNAPYEREWKLSSNYVNYRYYKIGALDAPKQLTPIHYKASKIAEFDEDPLLSMATNGGHVNYAYNFFEGVIDPETQEYRAEFNGIPTQIDVNHVDLSGESHTVNTYLADKFVDASDISKFSNKKVAPVMKDGFNVSEYSGSELNGDILDDTTYVSPNIARAVQVKTQIYQLLESYIKAWKDQDDNYRADQGVYDIDPGLDSSQSVPDKLTFMYTYEGMVRHGTKKAEGGVQTQRAGKGDTYYNDSILYPAIVSYLYDWEQYSLHNSMDTNYGSTHFQFNELGLSRNEAFKYIVDKLLIEEPERCRTDDSEQAYFPLYTEDIPEFSGESVEVDRPMGDGSAGGGSVNSNTILTCTSDFYWADLGYAKNAAKLVGSSVCVALQNTDELLKFGVASTLNPMNIGVEETGQETVEYGRNYKEEAWFDLASLYYRSIYSILLNYGSMFYSDELKELFQGDTPSEFGIGISTEGGYISDPDYNRHVNACLAAMFGQGPNVDEPKNHNTYIPLATFPRGGDLDGDMDIDNFSRNHSYIFKMSMKMVTSTSMHDPRYTYGVLLRVTDNNVESYTNDYSEVEYITADHNAGSHSHTVPGLCPVGSSLLPCPNVGGACDGVTHTGTSVCDNESYHVSVDTTDKGCVGPFSSSDWEWVDSSHQEKRWTCPNCDGEVVALYNIDLTRVPSGNIPNTNPSLPIAGSTRDPRYHTCKKCSGAGSNSWTCNQTIQKHFHYFLGGAEPVEGHGVPTLDNHEPRLYNHELTIEVNSENAKNTTMPVLKESMFVESPKSGGVSDSLVQRFENVQWMDITSYSLWQLCKGSVKGLSSILAQPINCKNLDSSISNTLITKAVDQLGYTVYDSKVLDKTDSTFVDSLANNTVYSNVAQNEWESLGVLANSWNNRSLGNYNGEHEFFKSPGTISGKGDPTIYGYAYSYFKNDVPILTAIPNSVENPYNYINADFSAFQLDGINIVGNKQVVTLHYNPMSQGGRSHTTFYGFYNQALAHTFYFTVTNRGKGVYISGDPKYSYGNSFRIEGDYLSLNKSDNKKVTLAGMFYDIWVERFGQYRTDEFGKYSSGKYSLLPTGYNSLTVFGSTCAWIPARTSVIFARQGRDGLYSPDVDGVVTNIADCWLIHSYCKGINGDYHHPWDGLAFANARNDAECEGIYCRGTQEGVMSRTDKGSVNINTHSLEDSALNTTAVDVKSRDCVNSGVRKKINTNLSKQIKLKDILAEGYEFYDQFNVKDISGNVTDIKSVAISGNTISIKLNHYLGEGLNTDTMMTSGVRSDGVSSQLESGMPYVGYQSNGIGTKDIDLNESEVKQKGYTSGYNTNFNSESTFVSPNKYVNTDGVGGGFEQFGVEGRSDTRVEDVIYGNKYTDADGRNPREFSAKYPWLAALNVNRYLANGYYKSGQAAVHYNKVGELKSPDWAKTYEHKSPTYVDSDGTLLFTTRYIKGDKLKGGHTDDASKPKWNAIDHLNSLVIYNPVSTQSAHIVKPTTYMPDAANNGGLEYFNNHLSAKRDTRVAYKYDLNDDDHEQYLSGTGIQSQSTKKHDYTVKVKKSISEFNTLAYIESDYDIDTNQTITDSFTTAEINAGTASFQITRPGVYSLTRIDTNNHWVSSKVSLMEDDIISFSERAKAVVLEMGTNNFEVPWDNVVSAYKKLQDNYKNNLNPPISGQDDIPENNPDGIPRDKLETVINYNNHGIGVPLYKNMTISVGGDLQLRAGSLLKLSLDVSKSSEDGAPLISDALKLNTDNTSSLEVKAFTSVPSNYTGEKFTYTWYIEALHETRLNGLAVTVAEDCFLWKTENILEAEKVVLMGLASDAGDNTPIQGVTSYEFFHGTSIYSDNSVKSKTFYNNHIVDIRGSYEIEGINAMTTAGFYIGMNGGGVSISLSDEALNNPHKVPNTDWRYYVLGWRTADGGLISSPTDERLFNNGTKLIIPASSKPITVGELRTRVKNHTLGAYRNASGGYGLIDLKDGKFDERLSSYTGYHVVKGTFDMIQYGDTDEIISKTGIAIKNKKPWSVYSEIHTISGKETQKYSFECVFECTDADNATTVNSVSMFAYDVKTSLYHRWSQDTETVDSSGKKLWEYDWDEKKVESVDFDSEEYSAVFADSLSLDDEFTIYWDNYSDLIPKGDGTHSDLQNTNIELGRGWDCVVDSGNKLSASAKQDSYWRTYTDGGDISVTDTTKWIYSKYVIFNVDMYAFADPSKVSTPYTYSDSEIESYPDGKWNPTTPAFRSNGKPNTIVYIPAGEKVFLGKYDAPDNEALDTGKFKDYGEGKNYTYHFWVPLSDGESDNQVTATYVVNSINGVELNSGKITKDFTSKPDSWDSSEVFPTYNVTLNPKTTARNRVTDDNSHKKITDEWGNAVLDSFSVDLDNNRLYVSELFTTGNRGSKVGFNLKEGYTRSGNALNYQSFSLIGRVGGLSIIDTGDPRYQDSFKIPDDLNEGDEGYYAIAPIVRAVTKYSNVKGRAGSQNKYVTDIIDVRGRYLHDDDSCGMVVAKSNDSYENTAWYRSASYITGHREFMPFSASFNIHPELRNSLTTTKLGYEIVCTLDTIGNFYGSSGRRPGKPEDSWVNNNLDYGQTKIQVHPMYVAFNTKDKKFIAVDAYMKTGSGYSLINAGSVYPNQAEAENDGSNDAGPYYLTNCFDASYTSVIDTNKDGISGDTYKLDQNMLRKSVTSVEAKTTYNVVHNHATSSEEKNKAFTEGVTTSMLDPNNYSTGGIGGDGLDYKYIYGNAQMLFLREFNRTFVGGSTLALQQTKEGTTSDTACNHIKRTIENAQRYGQRWYFGIGLPSSTKFVPHGKSPIEANFLNIDKHWYVITLLDIYSIGEKWALHYESPASKTEIELGDTYTDDEWNVYKEKFPYAIPVGIYDLNQSTASDDQSSRGSH